MGTVISKMTSLRVGDRFKWASGLGQGTTIFQVVKIDKERDVFHYRVVEGIGARVGRLNRGILNDMKVLHNNRVQIC